MATPGSSTVRRCRNAALGWIVTRLPMVPLARLQHWLRRRRRHSGQGVERHRRVEPDLRVYVDEGDTEEEVTAGHRPYWLVGVHVARRYHLHVENRGRSVAMACSGNLESLECLNVHGEWQRRADFGPLPLQWAEEGVTTAADLHPGASRRLNIARVHEGSGHLQLVSPTLSPGTRREYPAGTYRFTVSVTSPANRRARATGRFILEFGGDWDDVRIHEG